ncbi:hypothetical protein FB451DRAFT_432501 [Mycena latifolia]|nr:hypothetical protein FB451DRAFT_432501 [Mycena latifolia]
MARGRRSIWIFGCTLLLLGLLGLKKGPQVGYETAPRDRPASKPHAPPGPGPREIARSSEPYAASGKPRRVYLRVGNAGKEGVGSVLQHFKHSIVFSRALDSSLVLASSKNYVYSTSKIWNGQEDVTVDAREACRIQDHIKRPDRRGLVRAWCAGEKWAIEKLQKVNAAMANCTSIMDTDEEEFTEDLNGCIMGWVRERLAPPSNLLPPAIPLTLPPTRPITVGLHIRWGDTSDEVKARNYTTYFYGSMGVPNVTRVLHDIRTQAAPYGIKLTIAMHRAELDVIARLNLSEPYTLLDSPDDADPMSDLYTLSKNDILLVGESSYGVLTHLVAPPGGITVVQLQVNRHKYVNTTGFGRKVLYFQDWKPDSLRLALQGS